MKCNIINKNRPFFEDFDFCIIQFYEILNKINLLFGFQNHKENLILVMNMIIFIYISSNIELYILNSFCTKMFKRKKAMKKN